MSVDRARGQEITNELAYLRSLCRDRELNWAQVSADTLRYLLACQQMQDVLDDSKRLGVDSPLSSATDFADAQHKKWEAQP